MSTWEFQPISFQCLHENSNQFPFNVYMRIPSNFLSMSTWEFHPISFQCLHENSNQFPFNVYMRIPTNFLSMSTWEFLHISFQRSIMTETDNFKYFCHFGDMRNRFSFLLLVDHNISPLFIVKLSNFKVLVKEI